LSIALYGAETWTGLGKSIRITLRVLKCAGEE